MAHSDSPVVVALIAAYNEADIIGEVVHALVEDGVRVYFIDNHSTDGTVAEVERFRGKGVIGVETFPPASEGGQSGTTFEWGRILARKEELSRTLDADWFIHHDADEFRESPWDGVTLRDGIARADAAGCNAIDFHVLNFRPTTADPAGAMSIRDRMPFYEAAGEYDRLQIKCWKKTDQRVVLTATGGHSAEFAGRRVFPVRFLLRHYPIRDQAHGRRKVLEERVPRFSAAERAQGWHVQYDTVDRATAFVRDPAELIRYDADAVRLDLWVRHRGVEALERDAAATREEAKQSKQAKEALTSQLAARNTEFEFLRQAHARVERAVRDLARQTGILEEQLRGAAAAAADGQRERDDLARTAADLRTSIAARDADLANVRAERDALTHERHVLDRGLEIERATIARLRQQLGQTESEWGQLRADIDTLRGQLAEEQQLRGAADATVSSVLASRSWRMTAPLRKLDRKFGQPVPGARDLPLTSLPLGRGLWPDSDVTGYWSDGWAGATLRCRLVASRPGTELVIEGRVPAEITDGQVLNLAAGDETWTFHAPPGEFRWPIPLALKPNAPFLFVITAARVWQPSNAGASPDSRGLAWHVDRIDAG